MDEETGQGTEETTQEVETPPVAETPSNEGLNPAWNDLLSEVPQMLHSQLTPHLKKWDSNYQNSINKVHSQYEKYKQFDPFVEQEISTDQINYALNVMRAIDENPQQVLQALQSFLGEQTQETEKTVEQGQVETDIPDELFSHPKFQQMEQMVQTMAQQLVQQRQADEDAAQDAALTQELKGLSDKFGEFDEEYVLTRAAMNPNRSLEDHVKDYHAFVEKLTPSAPQRQPGPTVLGQGGKAPNNQTTTADLSDPKTRKNMVAQILGQSLQS